MVTVLDRFFRNLLHYDLKRVFVIFSIFSQRDFPKLDIYKCPFLQNPSDFFLRNFFGYDRNFINKLVYFYSTGM